MVEKLAADSSGSSRLERAFKHVSDYWFPVNTPLLKKIQNGLKEGTYDEDVDQLVSDIKGDFSLFTYCLRELSHMLADEEDSDVSSMQNPAELLRQSGIERLKVILSLEDGHVSKHSLQGSSDLQRMRFQEAATSAGAAEVLAESYDLDPELGFSAALLRQLGLTLISWNYPNVYQKQVSSLTSGVALDEALASKLGFSPSMLALRVVRDWAITPEVIGSVRAGNHSEATELAEESQAIASTLAKVAEVGEALARANNPDVYPSASDDWKLAEQEIQAQLGKNGLKAIHSRVLEHCQSYLELSPQLFKGGLVLDPERKISSKRDNSISSKNPYIESCSEEIKTLLAKLYQGLDKSSVSRDNLRVLINEIIPAARFTGGCLFTVDPSITRLVPQAKVGDLRTRQYRTISYSEYVTEDDMVAVAYKSNELIIRNRQLASGEILTCFAGVLGFSQRIGALYLELPQEIFRENEGNSWTHFKAISQAFNDSLLLN